MFELWDLSFVTLSYPELVIKNLVENLAFYQSSSSKSIKPFQKDLRICLRKVLILS